MGKRWTDPDYLAGLEESADALDRVKFWRSPVFAEKFWNVPAFLLPRLSEMASTAGRTDPVSFRLDEPPTDAERNLGAVLGRAFHQGCPLADIALATGLPPDRVVAIGERTIRRTKWQSRITDGDRA